MTERREQRVEKQYNDLKQKSEDENRSQQVKKFGPYL